MRLKSYAGSQLVEFALLLPMLLILVFGIIDFSVALYDKAVLTNASREGARAGVITTVPPPSNADITAVVTNYCSNAVLVTFGVPATPPCAVTIVRSIGGAGAPNYLTVTVRYSYDYAVISRLIPSLGSLNLSASTAMRLE